VFEVGKIRMSFRLGFGRNKTGGTAGVKVTYCCEKNKENDQNYVQERFVSRKSWFKQGEESCS
jgi:hypothetical protein